MEKISPQTQSIPVKNRLDEHVSANSDTFKLSAFKGLILRAAKDVTLTLYTEYKDGDPVMPAHSIEGETQNIYCYAISPGDYRCVAACSGYYKTIQNIHMSAEKASAPTEYVITLDKRFGDTATGNWELSAVRNYTEEFPCCVRNDDISQWPNYADVFTTPWFTEQHGIHQQTTQTQMERFLARLDSTSPNMYMFSVGKSAEYGYDMWAVLFTKTDLSSATTVEEAAALMGYEKPTVLYRAQIHGNEAASGEGALAMIQRLRGEYGEKLTENINICVLPRANPDGARNYTRMMCNDVDPNRDTLHAVSREVTDYLHLYRLLEPEMVIDGHEYASYVWKDNFWDGDVLVGAGFTAHNTNAFIALNRALIKGVFDAVTKNNLSYRYYDNQLNSTNANVSRAYTGQHGTLCFLLETRGNGIGMNGYARRVVAHVIAAEYLLNYASNNAQALRQTVSAERRNIIDRGALYREDNLVVLSAKGVGHEELKYPLKRFYQDGRVVTVETTPNIAEEILRSRIAPTAYVIPADADFAETVLALMDKHGIVYRYIPAGAAVQLRQYTGTAVEAGLTEEKTVTFRGGAYVFCKNQVRGVTLSMLMEPDVTDMAAYGGTFAQLEIITPTDGHFPIYRYCHDLNGEGFVDYTVLPV